MTFDELLAQVVDLLQREGRVSYRALKRRFDLDDEYIEDLKAEIINAKQLAVDEDGKVLAWIGKGRNGETGKWENGEKEVISSQLSVVSPQHPTPIVGREQEIGLLFERWEQAKDGRGQVVLLSGEPGIGKSRLAYALKEHVTNEGYLLIESRCSPYHQHSALYPLIEFLQRVLLLTRQETDSEKVGKPERALALYGMQETVLLFTALLSLPTSPTDSTGVRRTIFRNQRKSA
jgi:predicted AAA+ superfamily ATPase